MGEKKEFNFEQAFERLEKILDRMNAGGVALDESLKLYEEADQLIQKCQGKLSFAEEKIETLIKNRENKLEMDGEQKPALAPFES